MQVKEIGEGGGGGRWKGEMGVERELQGEWREWMEKG